MSTLESRIIAPPPPIFSTQDIFIPTPIINIDHKVQPLHYKMCLNWVLPVKIPIFGFKGIDVNSIIFGGIF